jgi:Fe-S cluster biosynthesis and repair protein YggX
MPLKPATQETEAGGLQSEASPGQKLKTLYDKLKSKKDWIMAQIIKITNEFLSSIPSATKKKVLKIKIIFLK